MGHQDIFKILDHWQIKTYHLGCTHIKKYPAANKIPTLYAWISNVFCIFAIKNIKKIKRMRSDFKAENSMWQETRDWQCSRDYLSPYWHRNTSKAWQKCQGLCVMVAMSVFLPFLSSQCQNKLPSASILSPTVNSIDDDGHPSSHIPLPFLVFVKLIE